MAGRWSAPAEIGRLESVVAVRQARASLDGDRLGFRSSQASLGLRLRAGVTSVILTDDLPGRAFSEDNLEIKPSNVQTWTATSALIIAEVVGTGVLALGGQMATVGLVFGLIVLFACYPLNLFTALLLWQVHERLPHVVTLGDALAVLVGPRTGMYGYFVLYTYIFMTMANYMIVLGDAVQSCLYVFNIPRLTACLIGALLLLPLNQFRTLSGLSVLSVVSFATVLGTLMLCLWTLLTAPVCLHGSANDGGYVQYSSAISGFVFAFAGQHIMLEMQVEMRTSSEFPKAVCLAFSVLFAVYTMVSLLAFRACAENTPGNLLLVLPADWRKSTSGALMVVHLLVTYTISQQVLNRAICLYLMPSALGAGANARVKWLGCTTICMLACCLVANLVPLFQDLVNLTGALLSTQCVFILPGVLSVVSNEKRWLRICSAGIIIIGFYLAVSGTICSSMVIVQKLQAPVDTEGLGFRGSP
ncbi:slc36a4 [Symbiodinium sp. KB8]|nr:slc36a4 [Symbiodinium sp. KB8]